MAPAIIAHRGASALAEHENTLEAFDIAIRLGVPYAEFDVRCTADSRIVVFHNPDVAGTALCALTYEEATRLAGYEIPLLADVLTFCKGKIKLDIELKESGYEETIVSLLNRHLSYDDYMVKSFQDKVVRRIKKLDPKITAGLLLGMKTADAKRRFNEYFPSRRIAACNADFVSPYHKLVTPGFRLRMKYLKKKIYAWTVNDEKLLRKFMHMSIDGVITDHPDLAQKFIKKQEEQVS